MKRYWRRNYISENGYSPATNKLVGGFTYLFFIILIWLISYKIVGIQMFEEPWFWAMHVIAFVLVKVVLRLIGFWVY